MNKLVRFINCTIPVTTCNLRCGYCFVTQSRQYSKPLEAFPYSPRHIANAISFKRMGGACLINLCGLGETLLPPEVIELTHLLLEQGHYVAIVTNGTISKRFNELCSIPQDLLKRLFIKFSLHYLELKRLNLLDAFFENINLIRANNVSFSLELVASENYIPYLDEIKELCIEKVGAYCHVLESRNAAYADLPRLSEGSLLEHIKVWSSFNSPLFNFQQELWGIKQNGFCYAGDYSADLDLWSGNLRQCNQGGFLQNVYTNVDEPIHFLAIGNNCPSEHCFIGYVWQVLCGNILEIPRVYTYSDLRNRICHNGLEWLNPTMKEAFDQNISLNHAHYSINKQVFINAVMDIQYGYYQKGDKNSINISKMIETHLKSQSIHSIAIWGTDPYGQWLFSLLQNTSIIVKYMVDCDFNDNSIPSITEKIKRRTKYVIKRILQNKIIPIILNRYDFLPDIDKVIISNYPYFNEIKRQIGVKFSQKTISLTDLVE